MSAFREALRELPDAVFGDVLESKEAYLVVFDLPGATRETIELTAERGCIHLEATCETEIPPDFEPVTEGRSSTIVFDLPVPIDGAGSDTEASIDRGVLELTVPKQERTTGTTIPITE